MNPLEIASTEALEKLKRAIGKRIAERREARVARAREAKEDWRKKWTQRAVAEALGVETTTYQRWEAGAVVPELSNLLKLSILFSEPIASFLGEALEAPPITEITPQIQAVIDATVERTIARETKLIEELAESESKNRSLEAHVRDLKNQGRYKKDRLGSEHQDILSQLEKDAQSEVDSHSDSSSSERSTKRK